MTTSAKVVPTAAALNLWQWILARRFDVQLDITVRLRVRMLIVYQFPVQAILVVYLIFVVLVSPAMALAHACSSDGYFGISCTSL